MNPLMREPMSSKIEDDRPVRAADAPPRRVRSSYPEPFASMMEGRVKRPLGDLFGLENFGVNLTTLPPGSRSALHHSHSRQDEFVYVVSGRLTLHVGSCTHHLERGDCYGFPAGGDAHHLVNEGTEDATVLEVGDRSAGDRVEYPEDDLAARLDEEGRWTFTHKDGVPYAGR